TNHEPRVTSHEPRTNMRIFYDLFFLIFGLFYIPGLLLKGKLHRDFPQKFGLLPEEVTAPERPVWIHAVSVGEAVVAAKLAGAIKGSFPDIPVIVSTTTRTGKDMLRKAVNIRRTEGAAPRSVDAVFYYPLDISAVVSRVVRLVKPRLYLMVETELWPNLLEELHLKGVPVVLANGRISDSSFGNYKKIRFFTKRILRCVDLFCMQSAKDAEKIKALGARDEKVCVTGNMKFDDLSIPSKGAGFTREELGFDGSEELLVAGSTHFPEEQMVIDVYRQLKEKKNNMKLVLAPRHVERADAIRIYIEKSGLRYRRFSDVLKGGKGQCDILLVDTIGHLKDIYSAASVVFVGGTLAKKGGQNPIEPARWGKPVVFGPDMSNFREIAEVFLENDAAVSVKDTAEMKKAIEDLLTDPGRRDRMAGNALKVIEKNSGTVARTVEKIEKYLEPIA
ncbi:MAG: 3-deoxy-D-manno-octulosonic acid transferase, partial [Candidatus Omnitrophota bacterium]|nr:3-deoxy-D-manno-octulosonic acid transferase [Candidatus Omnitrophota bacterium]